MKLLVDCSNFRVSNLWTVFCKTYAFKPGEIEFL